MSWAKFWPDLNNIFHIRVLHYELLNLWEMGPGLLCCVSDIHKNRFVYVLYVKKVGFLYLTSVLAFRYCHCLRLSVCVSKLGLPNLDQRCKTPLLRQLLFWGRLTLIIKIRFNLKFTPFWPCPKMHCNTVKIPGNFGLQHGRISQIEKGGVGWVYCIKIFQIPLL